MKIPETVAETRKIQKNFWLKAVLKTGQKG